MFGAVAPALNDDDRLRIAAAMVRHQTPAAKAKQLTDRIAQLDLPDADGEERPWEQGYELAREWMVACNLSTDERMDIDAHLKSLGVDVDETELSDKHTSGVALVLEGRAPFMLLRSYLRQAHRLRRPRIHQRQAFHPRARALPFTRGPTRGR